MRQQKIISFSDGKDSLEKKKRHRKIETRVQKKKRCRYTLSGCIIILLVYAVFTSVYYANYKLCPEDWEMTETRKNEKKCKEFRDIYKKEFDSQEIRMVSNKCLLAIMQENIDCSEILHYYIGDDGNAAFEATANVKLNNDFLNPSANEVEENTYRTIQVYPGYQDIIQGKEVFYRIENGTISDSWFEFYMTILETNYDYYYIDNYFEGFYTNPPDCHGVNIAFYKNGKCHKVTMLIAKNAEREDEFHNYIEGVAKKNWDIDDNNGPLGYLLRYSLNYPNKSYIIPEKVDEPIIDIWDILNFSFRNCYIFDNKEPLICINSTVAGMQVLQGIIFYFGIISCVIIPLLTTIVEKARQGGRPE